MYNDHKKDEQTLEVMQLIIDSIAKDASVQQGAYPEDAEEVLIDRGVFRELEDGEYTLDMYMLKGLDYSHLDSTVLLMPENYREIDIDELHEEQLGLAVDDAIGKVLETFPPTEGFMVRFFALPDYAYLPEDKGGIDTKLFIPIEESDDSDERNYVDVEAYVEGSEDEGFVDIFGDLEDIEPDDPENEVGLSDIIKSKDAVKEVAIFMFDGVDFDKVKKDNLNLDDGDVYVEVTPTYKDLESVGIDVEEITSKLGVKIEDGNIHFMSLPEEYYLSPDNGGIAYSYFPSLNKKDKKRGVDNTSDLHDLSNDSETDKDSQWVNDLTLTDWEKVIDMLEEYRNTKPKRELNALSEDELGRLMQEYVDVDIDCVGYRVKSYEVKGVNIVMFYTYIRAEGVDGVIGICFKGVYPIGGKDSDFEAYIEEYGDADKFYLVSVRLIGEEEWKTSRLMD